METIFSSKKELVGEKNYLGPKGYTILKRELDEEKLKWLRTELTATPLINGVPGTSFPVYRESESKIYIPRFIGTKHFGVPGSVKRYAGDSIDVEFHGQLRENQIPVVDAFMKGGACGLLELPCAYGKCLGKDTPVMLFDGSIKKVQDICVGNMLRGDDSIPRVVLGLGSGREMMYEIKDLSNLHTSYKVNKSHILSLKMVDRCNEIVDISVEEYLTHPRRSDFRGYRHASKMTSLSTASEFARRIRTRYLQIHNDCIVLPKSDEDYHRIKFLALSLGHDVTETSGKMTIQLSNRQIQNTYEISVEPCGVDEYFGFQISGNCRFLLGDFTVTHNTVLSLNIISILKKKTLVIVHKEFLLNQWKDRVAEFLPSARIGRIQGSTFDIEDKDIVFGMLQSLSMKDYEEKCFESFGLTVIDEVHHISSEIFSRALFRIVTCHMLGLSATMIRKDGTTNVFKMFLGDVLFRGKHEVVYDVEVRLISYSNDDEKFNHVIKNYKGNVIYSSMISKLCDFEPRSLFILHLLHDLLIERKGQQIMLLAHNRCLLEWFHLKLTQASVSVGFYVGGMKEAALKESETRQVILATYSMASEALDIKTLTTLIMATPKTDIEQAVGRILRVKHSSPLVIDIADSHLPFQGQAKKRLKFYKNQGYRINKQDK